MKLKKGKIELEIKGQKIELTHDECLALRNLLNQEFPVLTASLFPFDEKRPLINNNPNT